MEQLLHYVWKHRLWPARPLFTTDGRAVEVIDPGLHNMHSGPDFFNAKVKINQTLWVGNVEIHDKASDWYLHGHDRDSAYDNVVLHVASLIDRDVCNTRGEFIPQLQLGVSPAVSQHYEELVRTEQYPPCYRIIPQLSSLTVHAWMAALQTERLEQKTKAIEQRARRQEGSWEAAYFMTLARNYGFGINGEAFEEWAARISLSAVGHHRDDLFQVEAFFLGQAGLLCAETMSEAQRQAALADDYFLRLQREYAFLAHKFSLQPMDGKHWRFLRTRPQNFPYTRLSQLAWLFHQRKTSLSQLIDCTTLAQLRAMMQSQTSAYWETHYTFGRPTAPHPRHLSAASIDLLLINTCIPMLFAYGRHAAKESLCERAFDLLDQISGEDNVYVRIWKTCGLKVKSAGDSQALIQLKKEYCDRKDCLRCRFGYEYLRRPDDQQPSDHAAVSSQTTHNEHNPQQGNE